jgi:3-hydroxyacyl-CoA dehydrogenase/enoyl-CoA hydratase/3-hydroxybutyryl-CoA epimerase
VESLESVENMTTDEQATDLESEIKSAFALDVREDGVAILTMDVPGESMNTLKVEFAEQIESVLQQINANSSIKGVVVISGKGNSFVAGADISMLAACETAEDAKTIAKGGQDMFQRIEDMPVTFVAAIHGPALGGGLELALACHYRV